MDREIANRGWFCRLCSLTKPVQNKHLSEVAKRPNEKLFIDYVRKFPRSKGGNRMLPIKYHAWYLKNFLIRLLTKFVRNKIFIYF